MSLIVKAKIKEFAKHGENSLNVSGDLADALNTKIEELIKDACRRAKENGRNTVMAKDL
jgi:histone H3/H4|tara:strand:+ start:533 stop:709 length:177 start_codon:yes stop_codon:yes gene_type:complete